MMRRITSLSVVAVLCMTAFVAVVYADGDEDVFDADTSVIGEAAVGNEFKETGHSENTPAWFYLNYVRRYFRPGIEANYSVWRSNFEFWDNEFPYEGIGLGVFLRIGAEPLYFTTGIYQKSEFLKRRYSAEMPLHIIGIPIGSIPLLDLRINRDQFFWEVPILLNYMFAKQIRFTVGALLNFLHGDYYSVSTQSNLPIGDPGWSTNWQLEDQIEEIFSEHAPDGNMYWAFGLDFDISKYWGIGVKYLIHNHNFGGSGEFEEYFEPSQHQFRLSTYFVF